MNPEILTYNAFQTNSAIDLWQLRNFLSAELNKSETMPTTFDFLLDENNHHLQINIEAVVFIEMAGWDMHSKPSNGESQRFIKALFDGGFPRHIIYGVERSLLKMALDQNDLVMFKLLLDCVQRGAAINQTCDFLLPQIFANRHCNNFIQTFLDFSSLNKLNIKLDQKNSDGTTFLMSAAKTGNMEMLELLITAGARLDEVNHDGDTALLIAAKEQNLEAVIRLVQHGANIKSINKKGISLLTIACQHSNDEKPALLNYLIENNFEALFDDLGGTPILVHAIRQEYDISTIKQLLSKERINQQCPKTGNTPLIMAYLCSGPNSDFYDFNDFNDELIDLLLEADANPLIENKKNQNAMTIAKLKYNDRDEDDEDAENYDDAIEANINKLAFKSHDLLVAQDLLIEDTFENHKAKLKLKSQTIKVLKLVNDYIEEDYNKAWLKIDEQLFAIAFIFRDQYFFGGGDNFERVITQLEKLKHSCICIENYTKGQFEIASMLIVIAHEVGTDSEKGRALLIRALKHADNAKKDSLSNQLLGSLSGKVMGCDTPSLSTDNYQRIDFFTEENKCQKREILELKRQLAEQAKELAALKRSKPSDSTLSSLIRKRADSLVVSSESKDDDEKHIAKKPCL